MIFILDADLFDVKADVLAHQVNCMGVMGSGVAAQVKQIYPEAFHFYKKICSAMTPYALLGMMLLAKTQDPNAKHQAVANLCGQFGYGRGFCHTDYESLRMALGNLAERMTEEGFRTVALPYNLGCGRGGGNWDIVLNLIETQLKDFDVYICRKDMG